MTDPMRALEAFRDVDVPVGARTRVRARLEEHVDRRAITQASSRRRWASATALFVLAVALVGLPRSEARTIVVAAGDRYDIALDSGQVSIRGPAAVHVSRDQLSLLQGTVAAHGQLRVKGPTCNVDVRGSVEVSVTGAKLTARVFAGSVEITPPAITCEVIELTPKRPITASAARDVATPPANKLNGDVATPPANESSDVATPPANKSTVHVVTSPRVHEPRVASPPRESSRVDSLASRAAPVEVPPVATAAPRLAPAVDPLADAVAAYHAAVALEAHDLHAARQAWQTWRARWSWSPLAHSADLHLLAVLDRLDRHDEASDLAREFVGRYPRSPRRAEVERMIRGGR